MPNAEPNKPTEEETNPDDEQPIEATDDDADEGDESEGDDEAAPKKKPKTGADDDFENLTPREKLLVQKARAQEKQKLYTDLRSLRQKVKELEKRTAAPTEEDTPARRRKKDDEETDLRAEIRSLRQEITEREQKAEMRAYRAEKIAEARRDGARIIESLVAGDTEDDIDAAIEVAKAEAEFIYAEAEANLAAQNGGGGRTRTHVVRDGPPRRPAGVTPSMGSSGAGSGDESNGYSLEEIKELTSMESLRDGTWATKRKAVLHALREGRIRH